MGYADVFLAHDSVHRMNVGAVHNLQTGAFFEGDESTGELFYRIMIKWLDYPTEILSVEFADLIDVFYPNGYVFYFHGWKLKFREPIG